MSFSDFDDDEGDDGDYELEPVDEHVTRHAKNLARDEVTRAGHAVDIDKVYQELEGRVETDFSWEPGKFSFGIKHLLIATGAFALMLGFWRMGFFSTGGFSALIALALVVLGAIHTFFDWRDRRRREAVLARQRYDQGRAKGEIGIDVPPPEVPPSNLSDAWEDVQHDLRQFLRFGIRELLIITAVVAVMMTVVLAIGIGPTAVLVGMFALGGLGLQALDFDLPRPVRIAWWASILAYCVLTVVGTIISAFG